FTVIGAGVISVIEYFYLRFGESRGLSWLASTFASKNPELFVDEEENSPEFVQELIESGEGEKLEFKSTLRVNLHTGERDEDVEHAVLKTITAFLNTDGGTLLIGVSDDGEVTGIQKDEFGDNDKFYRHYSNLVRHHIDNKYLSLIQSNLIQMDGKHILKVDCRSSNEGVFLKVGDEQEFYVRTGPASVQLKGKKLVDYINQKYK
ncbi:MAG: ATP-binding protein, partial [Hadesarchaea archaeon]|nr:ATP-binding protein [Hadesarchaea archaeon]